jgi:hypothetical protein
MARKAVSNSDARKQKIIRDVQAANPDINPTRVARIVDLTLRLAQNRKG